MWQRGLCIPVFWARKDATFTYHHLEDTHGKAFHAVIDFSEKWPGAFTCDIIVTEGLEPFEGNPPRRMTQDIPDLLTGSYRIGWFVAGRDIWWRLVDDAAESNRMFEKIPGIEVEALSILFKRCEGDWYASSYDRDQVQVVQEASEHLCDTFECHVVPKLLKNA